MWANFVYLRIKTKKKLREFFDQKNLIKFYIMGRVFLEHINGTQKLYNCGNCDTNLTNKSQLISTR